jgi:hypothetical protein
MKVIGAAVVVVVILTTTVFATVGSRTAELFYNNIKVILNGKEITPTDANGNAIEPFIIDGTTYLPVRGVASALGLNVGWDAATSSVTLDNPGVFQGGVQVYDDDKVTIEFAGCRAPSDDDWLKYYYADFNIKNKTDVTLTFQPKAISFDGISYQLTGSEEVAPQSTGKVSFTTDDMLPTSGISKTSGEVTVIDFDKLFDTTGDSNYSAKWVNVTQSK